MPHGGIFAQVFRGYLRKRRFPLHIEGREGGLLPGLIGEELLFFLPSLSLPLLAFSLRAGEGFLGFLELHHRLQLPFLKHRKVPAQRSGFLLQILQLFGVADASAV